MRRTIDISIFVFQITLTFITAFCTYMFFAVLDSDLGFDGLVVLFIFQQLWAVIISGLTILLCLIVGLPIRLNKKINHWWTTNFYIPIIGIVVGLSLLILATLNEKPVLATIEGKEVLKQIPDLTLMICGWLLTAFCILHTYPPRRLTDGIKAVLKNSK